MNAHGVTAYYSERDLSIDSDILYREYLTRNGGIYELLLEKHHTKEDIDNAKKWLRQNLDVVQIVSVRE